jgi:hypothetical protein
MGSADVPTTAENWGFSGIFLFQKMYVNCYCIDSQCIDKNKGNKNTK